MLADTYGYRWTPRLPRRRLGLKPFCQRVGLLEHGHHVVAEPFGQLVGALHEYSIAEASGAAEFGSAVAFGAAAAG